MNSKMDTKRRVNVAVKFYTNYGWKSRNGGINREISGTAGKPFSSVTSESPLDISSTDFSRTHGDVNSEIREEFKMEDIQNVSNVAGGSTSSLKVEKKQIKLNYAIKPIKTEYKCYVCGEKIQKRDRLVLHLKDHMGANRYKCDECGHKFKELKDLKKHLLISTDKDDGYRFKCSYCSHTFMQKSSCRNHERVHVQTEEPCCLCELSFPNFKQLKDHVQTVHRREKDFKCSLCGNSYACATNLQRHIKNVSRDLPYKCLTCGHRYSSELGLRRHEYEHGKIKSVICLFCLEMFTTKTHLARHLDRRRRLNQYQCKGCKKKFASSKYLIKHLEIHSADRPFRCSKCGHTFTSQGLLFNHMRMHTGESWRCMSCGDTFKKKAFLLTHLQIHSTGFCGVKGNRGKKTRS